MRLGVAEADPFAQRVAGRERDARISNVEGVRDVVTDPLEGGFGGSAQMSVGERFRWLTGGRGVGVPAGREGVEALG